MGWTDKGIKCRQCDHEGCTATCGFMDYSEAEAMWERFVAKLNETQPLRNGEHVAMLGSIESYKRIFLEANK